MLSTSLPENKHPFPLGVKVAKAQATKITPYLPVHSEEEEARRIQAAREKLAAQIAAHKRQLGILA